MRSARHARGFVPERARLEQAVGDGEQLAHAGGDGDLVLLACGGEVHVKIAERGVLAAFVEQAEDAHEERVADLCAAALDAPLAANWPLSQGLGARPASAAISRRESSPEFREACDQDAGDAGPDARNTVEDFVGLDPLGFGLDERINVRVDGRDALIQVLDEAGDVAADAGRFIDVFEAVFLGGAHQHKLLAACGEAGEFELLFGGAGARVRAERCVRNRR